MLPYGYKAHKFKIGDKVKLVLDKKITYSPSDYKYDGSTGVIKEIEKNEATAAAAGYRDIYYFVDLNFNNQVLEFCVREDMMQLYSCEHKWADTGGLKKTWCLSCNTDGWFELGHVSEAKK